MQSKCDRDLSTKWYRFSASAGATMPEFCVPRYLCGTRVTGWLNGTHPRVHEGVVSRQVCFHDSNCCWRRINIRIRNCGGFYVYELKAPPDCPMRYCGGPSNLTSRLRIFYFHLFLLLLLLLLLFFRCGRLLFLIPRPFPLTQGN